MAFHRITRGQHLQNLKADDINAVFDILDKIRGIDGIVITKSATGYWTISLEKEDGESGVEVSDTQNRCVVDWKYDATTHRIMVLYGTLTKDGDGKLAIVPDMDGNGNLAWNDGTNQSANGGGGTQAVEESY